MRNKVINRCSEWMGALPDNMLEITKSLVRKHVSSLCQYVELDILPIERIQG
jgi:hypothetical protein